jgi:hypothetical protein
MNRRELIMGIAASAATLAAGSARAQGAGIIIENWRRDRRCDC